MRDSFTVSQEMMQIRMLSLWLRLLRKLVGIISHVGELKERIDRQIIVTKEKAGGSRAEII